MKNDKLNQNGGNNGFLHNVKVVAPPSEGAASMQKGGSEMTSKIRLAAGWRLPTHGLLCFFIFSGQAVFATSSPLDQIPSPSGWSLGILALVGVLGALLGAWVNPTLPNKLGSKKATQPQQAGEQKTEL